MTKHCPMCEGTGRVYDMRPKEPKKIVCPTCRGRKKFALPRKEKPNERT